MTITERTLAWGILMLGLAALWLGLGLPALRHFDATTAEIARMNTLAQRYEAEAARRPTRPGGTIDATLLTPAGTDAQGQAALQERVKSILAGTGGILTGLQPQPPQGEGPWRVFPLSVQFTGDMSVLQRTLHDLETARPLIAVDAIQVRPRGRAGAAAGLEIAIDAAAFAARQSP